MIRLPLVRRSDGDDNAPVDYSFSDSLAEGLRRTEAQALHQLPADPVVRRRTDPYKRGIVDAYGTRARRSPIVPKPSDTPVRRGFPPTADSPAPVERTADPLEDRPADPEPARREVYNPPAQPQIPEWLRAARQNNAPRYDRRIQPPQIIAPASRYDEYASPQAPVQTAGLYAPPTSYGTPYEDDSPADAKPWRNIPWLGVAGLALALIGVGLWLAGLNFTNQKNLILQSHKEEAETVQKNHPYRYRQLIETQAQIYNLHPAYIAAIVLNESSFDPTAESRVGARGLMQMMPDTAEWIHDKISRGQPYSFDNMYDPNENVHYACWYLNFLSERFRGDPVLVASAFHAGQNTVQNWLNEARYSADGRTIVLEDMPDGPTKNYAVRVMRAYAVYKRLYYEDIKTEDH
ncbi:MAG: transglycosylase SLT domain-containing protein [Clostridia bacterium]|nr:transglycosylase SLT domain-containing protein [Clostridia bacterium]